MMKNKFLFLMILGLAFFASCSDDDDDKAQTYKGETLTLSVGGVEFPGREAVLDGSVLTVKKALPGEAETAFSVVREGDKITGVNTNANREVSLAGMINGGKLGLDLTLKMKSSMTAKWSVSTLFFNVETTQEKIVLGGEETTVVEFVETINGLGALIPMLMPAISFEEDGNIVATYMKDMSAILGGGTPEYINSPKGMALYNVVDNKIFVALNIAGIIADASTPKASANIGRSDYNPLESLISMAEEGIPLYLRATEEEGMEVYLDREMLLPIVKMLPMLLEVYGDQLGEMKELLTGLVQVLSTLIEGSTKSELGLRLVPFVENPAPEAQSFSNVLENIKLQFGK